MERKSRGLLDTPQEPVIGLAEGETRWRGMTTVCEASSCAVAQRAKAEATKQSMETQADDG